MLINLHFVKIYIEKWTRLSGLKVRQTKHETIIDFAYWRFYLNR